MKASEDLKSVLCDPEGNVCIDGSHGDLIIIADAILKTEKLEQELAKLKVENEKLNNRFNNLTTFLIADLNFGGGFVSRLMDNELTKIEKKFKYDIFTTK